MTDAPDEMSDRRVSVWHFGKEIPITLLLALGLQTFGVVWWFAGLSAKVDNIDAKVATLAASVFTSAEARGMNELNSHRNLEQDRRIGELEKELRALVQSHQQMMMMGGRR